MSGKQLSDMSKLTLANAWLKQCKVKTLVHALVFCEKGLKDKVDEMLSEGKSSREISNELHRLMDDKFEGWKIPSHMAIETYKKYADDDRAISISIARSKYLSQKADRINKRYDLTLGILSKLVDLEEQSEYFHKLRMDSKLPVTVGIEIDKLLLEYQKFTFDVLVRTGKVPEVPKELRLIFTNEKVEKYGNDTANQTSNGSDLGNPEVYLRNLDRRRKRIDGYADEIRVVHSEGERLDIEEAEIVEYVEPQHVQPGGTGV